MLSRVCDAFVLNVCRARRARYRGAAMSIRLSARSQNAERAPGELSSTDRCEATKAPCERTTSTPTFAGTEPRNFEVPHEHACAEIADDLVAVADEHENRQPARDRRQILRRIFSGGGKDGEQRAGLEARPGGARSPVHHEPPAARVPDPDH